MAILGELHSITAHDGLVYWLTDGENRFVVTTPDSAGLPPVDYLTRRPYKADRLVETGFRLNPRSFSVQYQFLNDCSRDVYWQARADLLNALRPNRGGDLTYTIIRDDGTKRAINARAITPVFPAVPVEEVNEWNLSEALQLEAFDPVWFDPATVSNAVANTPAEELAFSIAFDDDGIYFGAGSEFGSLAIPYTGTWYTYPVITITPPYSSVRIHHNELNVDLEVLRSSSTQNMVIDLDAGTIRFEGGVSLFGFLTPDSDLQGFRIEPDPIVSGGVNTLVFSIPGATSLNTTVTVEFKTRYIGI